MMSSLAGWQRRTVNRTLAVVGKRKYLRSALKLHGDRFVASGAEHAGAAVLSIKQLLRSNDEELAELHADLQIELAEVKESLQQPVLRVSSRSKQMMCHVSILDGDTDRNADVALKKLGPLLEMLGRVERELHGSLGAPGALRIKRD
jgi:hypothetical protein